MKHPLAVDPAYIKRLMDEGALTIRVAPAGEVIVKDGPPRKRVKKPSAASIMRLQEKQAHLPPLCSRAGCQEVCKEYIPSVNSSKSGWGKLCPAHAAEACVAERACRMRKKGLAP